MNGYKLLEDAARLIGLESADENLKIIGLPIVNAVLAERGFAEISSLSGKIGISSERVCTVLRFGVATLIAGALGDTSAEAFAKRNYREHLAKLPSNIKRVRDVLPKEDF